MQAVATFMGSALFPCAVPVGRTFGPDTNDDREGDGIAPDVEVPEEAALAEALVRCDLGRAEAERMWPR
jgi:hypothetical protein